MDPDCTCRRDWLSGCCRQVSGPPVQFGYVELNVGHSDWAAIAGGVEAALAGTGECFYLRRGAAIS